MNTNPAHERGPITTRTVRPRPSTPADRSEFVGRHPDAWFNLRFELLEKFHGGDQLRQAVNTEFAAQARYGYKWLRENYPCVITDYERDHKKIPFTYKTVRQRIVHWSYRRDASRRTETGEVRIQRGVRSNEHLWLYDRTLWHPSEHKFICKTCSKGWR